ncbi:sigma-E factor negative regulatory protein [Piscinibacter koreensis]|uniref:Sigma-E factor negative regulatory protein n=1 Tax=Piscinibacter koreensis TaxID=2742824 RepID=A0A7Y6NPI3_9BURK|nr:sigma-E factor negative regulatory protein [Schlegelella koreensis]NUZ06968.1 sigma-E factor negative regulatory protein [Schlegelella koreensis]
MQTPAGSDAAMERLSALVDGELDLIGADQACSSWRDDASARSTWHAYQLIGDVLRSDDLASDGDHDASFLAAFRERLAAEPVVLAPAALPDRVQHADDAERVGSRTTWKMPVALAAGFVMVIGVTGLVRTNDAPSTTAAGPMPVVAPSMPAPATVASNGVIRDPTLDRYLAAHRQFGGTSMLGASSVFVRSAAADGPRR